MKSTNINFNVKHPSLINPSEVCSLMSKLIDVGLADARDSAEDPDLAGECDEAKLVLQLDIGGASYGTKPEPAYHSSVVIFYEHKALVIVHIPDLVPDATILDWYSQIYAFEREKLSLARVPSIVHEER